LERGLSVTEGETVESYKRGIELILKQLRDQLASAGVQPIRVTGKMFDPNFHQAVMREESAVLPENEIIEEMQRGYTFKDRLLRPSMVKVAVAPAQAQAEEPAAPGEVIGDESEVVE
jgi:molecular chaperone GrpE